MCAVVPIRRIWNLAARVADASRDDSRPLPEEILHSPEAPSGKDRLLETFAGGSGHVLVRFAHQVHVSKVATVGSRSGNAGVRRRSATEPLLSSVAKSTSPPRQQPGS